MFHVILSEGISSFYLNALQQIHVCVMLLRLEKIRWGEK